MLDLMPSVGLLSLGCARNLVDSEIALGGLIQKGYPYCSEVNQASIAIVNTCGFTQDAKQESIQAILELAELKKTGQIQMLIVMGCLSQRYPKEIAAEIAEADIILGTDSFADLDTIIREHSKTTIIKSIPRPKFLPFAALSKQSLTPKHFTYIKISEGCINACSYCAIPSMKGKHRSRSIDDIVLEARQKTESGDLKEINLIGQDTAAFGWDNNKQFLLPDLLEALAMACPETWIRPLYAHPAHIEPKLIDVMKSYTNICNYIDVPIEHSHPDMLKRMNRGINRVDQDKILHALKKSIPNLTLRTAVIVGFPGETEEEFEDLLDCMREIEFDRLGTFVYSKEEGTRAFNMDGQISEELKQERFSRVMELQETISLKKNQKKVGHVLDVLIEEESKSGALFIGRSEGEAPEVDGQILIKTDKGLPIGQFAKVQIHNAFEHDLSGVLVN